MGGRGQTLNGERAATRNAALSQSAGYESVKQVNGHDIMKSTSFARSYYVQTGPNQRVEFTTQKAAEAFAKELDGSKLVDARTRAQAVREARTRVTANRYNGQ